MNSNYIDQPLNLTSIRRFLTRHESILLFLSLTLVVAVLLVVFGQPTSILNYFDQRSSLTPLGQITISFISGFGVLLLSRLVLFLVGRKRDLAPAAMVIWIVAELILCVSVMALVLWGLCGGGAVNLTPLVGDLVLGTIGVLLVPTVVTYLIRRLREAQGEVMRMRQLLGHQDVQAKQAADASINFFAKGGRLAFSTRMGNILYIEAADNYVNIHYVNGEKEETFILFNSMKNIEKSFAGTSLMRCHRGYMVNADNVRLMRKEALGLVLEINHCAKTIPVSKSFAEPVTQYFAYNTNMTLPNE
jgi:hypothetical protein